MWIVGTNGECDAREGKERKGKERGRQGDKWIENEDGIYFYLFLWSGVWYRVQI